jgi:hypothetical protein
VFPDISERFVGEAARLAAIAEVEREYAELQAKYRK